MVGVPLSVGSPQPYAPHWRTLALLQPPCGPAAKPGRQVLHSVESTQFKIILCSANEGDPIPMVILVILARQVIQLVLLINLHILVDLVNLVVLVNLAILVNLQKCCMFLFCSVVIQSCCVTDFG